MTVVKQEAAAQLKGPCLRLKKVVGLLWYRNEDGRLCTSVEMCVNPESCKSGIVAVYGSGEIEARGDGARLCLREGEWAVAGRILYKTADKITGAALLVYFATRNGIRHLAWCVDYTMPVEKAIEAISCAINTLEYSDMSNKTELSKWLDAISDLLGHGYTPLKERLNDGRS
ncbi:hypothetical protein [Pyrobaculum sp.]|uniref:hypothetical protein n=1 Tax=Pyrobaculum sp. TaxID=2004705 RepID=UPI003D0EA7D3